MYDPRQQSYTKAEYDALRVELAKHKEVIEYAAAMDKQATLGILELEANFKAKDEEIVRLQPFERFYRHIYQHLKPGDEVICKICGKSMDQIEQSPEGE
ncbi:MAG TPA: hypothetical protein VMV58_04755 [Desulfosporosinus sp.]|nr:hypothetical protein [Desulfosporosinus sp.]